MDNQKDAHKEVLDRALGREIARALAQAKPKLSQYRAAQLLGVSKVSVNQWVHGQGVTKENVYRVEELCSLSYGTIWRRAGKHIKGSLLTLVFLLPITTNRSSTPEPSATPEPSGADSPLLQLATSAATA